MPLHNTSERFTDYFNRTESNDRVEAIMFRASQSLQSAELNELGSIINRRLDSIADAVFKNGDVVEAAEIFVIEGGEGINVETRDGRIYVEGSVYPVAGEGMIIPFDARVQVGLRFRFYEIDEIDDISLLDPAEGFRNYGVGGAARKKSEYHWGWRSADDSRQDAREDWSFYPIYEVDHGVVVPKNNIGVSDANAELVARYDREVHGNYIVKGFTPSFVYSTDSTDVFDVKEGVANIYGYKVERTNGTRVTWLRDADVRNSNNEPHVFNPGGDGKFKLIVNRAPIATIGEIIGTKEKTVTVTRGAFSGGSDQLPDSSVVNVISVSQGATVYAVSTSYVVTGDQISWSPAGPEPAPSSSYTVTYRYLATVTPVEQGYNYVTLSGLVPGSFVQIDYDYKLPRVDVLALKRDGTMVRLRGISQLRNPQPPTPPPDQIELGQVYLDWIKPPVIRQTAIKATPMFELSEMRETIQDLMELIAVERLNTNVAVNDPSSKLGLFVDAFYDDDLRDQGIPQTGAIYDGVLTLGNVPVVQEPSDTEKLRTHWLLPFTLEVVLEQPLRSGCMLINPYQAFDPLPCVVSLAPSADRWVEWNYSWTSPTTAIVNGGTTSAGLLVRRTQSVRERMLSVSFQAIQFIRQREVAFTIKGFLPNEVLSVATFDGINVTPP